jgi:hypothetical protein
MFSRSLSHPPIHTLNSHISRQTSTPSVLPLFSSSSLPLLFVSPRIKQYHESALVFATIPTDAAYLATEPVDPISLKEITRYERTGKYANATTGGGGGGGSSSSSSSSSGGGGGGGLEALFSDLRMMVANAKAFNQEERVEWRCSDMLACTLDTIAGQVGLTA